MYDSRVLEDGNRVLCVPVRMACGAADCNREKGFFR